MICKNCGTHNAEDAAFCVKCGTPLKETPQPAVQQAPQPPPAAYPQQPAPGYPQQPAPGYPQQPAYGYPAPPRRPLDKKKIGIFAGIGALALVLIIVLVVVLAGGGKLSGTWEVIDAASWSDFRGFKDEGLYLNFKGGGKLDIVVPKDHPQREFYEFLMREQDEYVRYEVDGNLLIITFVSGDYRDTEIYRFEKEGKFLQIFDRDGDLEATLRRR